MIFPDTPTGRFATLMAQACGLVAYRMQRPWEFCQAPPVSAAVLMAVRDRVMLIWRLFGRLAERVRLGTVRVYPDRASPRRLTPGASPAGAGGADATPPAAAVRLPQGFGWLLRVMTRWPFGPMLETFLADPEVVALIGQASGFARLLRPLCRAMGVVPPAGLFPPLPRRPSRARPRSGRGRVPTRAARGAAHKEPSPSDCLATPQDRDRAWAARRRGFVARVDAGNGTAPAVAERRRRAFST